MKGGIVVAIGIQDAYEFLLLARTLQSAARNLPVPHGFVLKCSAIFLACADDGERWAARNLEQSPDH